MIDLLIDIDAREEASLRALEEVSSLFGEPEVSLDEYDGMTIPVQAVGMSHHSDWADEHYGDIEAVLNWYDIVGRRLDGPTVERMPGVTFDPADWVICAQQEHLFMVALAHYLDSDDAPRFRHRQVGNRVTVMQISPTEVIVTNGHHRIARAMIRRERVTDAVFIMTPDPETLAAEIIDPIEHWVATRVDGMTPSR